MAGLAGLDGFWSFDVDVAERETRQRTRKSTASGAMQVLSQTAAGRNLPLAEVGRPEGCRRVSTVAPALRRQPESAASTGT